MNGHTKSILEYLMFLKVFLEYITPSERIPIIILLRASGWRISDILNLRYNNCLDKTSQGWYLYGDIQKTQVLNHRVPITDEVAAVIKSVIIIEWEYIRHNLDAVRMPLGYCMKPKKQEQ